MKMQSKVVCFVGPSGVGKTSYAKRLVKKYGLAVPTVITTRQRRSDDGENYQYVSESTFLEMVKLGSFLEWDRYLNYYYGTLAQSVKEIINSKHPSGIILDLTPVGCQKVKKLMPSAVVIALLPDNPEWLIERLISRNSQISEEIQLRTKLLNSYLDEVNSLACKKVYASFSADSWDDTFEAIEKIVFKPEILSG
jgi:guanylate kinase